VPGTQRENLRRRAEAEPLKLMRGKDQEVLVRQEELLVGELVAGARELLLHLLGLDARPRRRSDLGIEVEVDVSRLVERIMLGPALSKDEMDIVIEQSRRAGLGDRIVKSSLLGEPRYY